ncbi:MAG TPA: hypothetical protein EYQ22_18285 [Gammaproteobacteria bacterium]|nr:hypothetical protein [Gammaproteobacteria bacterium]HIK68661.1 hypothetical protein [Pseudomonadales bacterium]
MNILVRTKDVATYAKGLGQFETALHNNGFKDITLQAFLAETGDYTGLVMTSMAGTREYVRGIFMDCETIYVAN